MSADGDRDGDGTLAAEYALGVLDARDRLRAERLRRGDAGFAAEADAWEARLAPLHAASGEVSPPARLWAAIEAELPRRRAAAAAPVQPPLAAAGRRVAALWQWLAIGTSAVALTSLAGLAITLAPVPARPTFAASISAADGAALFAAVVDPASGEATLVPVGLRAMDGGVPELWVIPAAGGQPISLGVIDDDTPMRMNLRAPGRAGRMEMMEGGATLAVSIEPAGGSPTGQPTGPVIGQGPLHSI